MEHHNRVRNHGPGLSNTSVHVSHSRLNTDKQRRRCAAVCLISAAKRTHQLSRRRGRFRVDCAEPSLLQACHQGLLWTFCTLQHAAPHILCERDHPGEYMSKCFGVSSPHTLNTRVCGQMSERTQTHTRREAWETHCAGRVGCMTNARRHLRHNHDGTNGAAQAESQH